MQGFQAKHYEEDLTTIIKYTNKIFNSLKCSVEGHRSAPSSFCFAEFCEKRLLCPECLVKDSKHSTEHAPTTITIAQFLDHLMVVNMDAITVNQYKLMNMRETFEGMWKGLQLCYRVDTLHAGVLHQEQRDHEAGPQEHHRAHH